MSLSRSRFYISLYIIIPAIIAGLSVIAALVSFRITEYLMKNNLGLDTPINVWIFSITALSVVCGILIVQMLLNPMKKFLKEAEKLPALSAHSEDKAPGTGTPKDELVHYTNVFKKITDVLNKVDARQLFPKIIGESVAMRGILKQILKVAPTDSTVLILGESGTGKELIATSLFEHSKRFEKPFVKLNCATIPGELLESELFGHEKGAFTGAVSRKSGKFEVANGGTIFLDEIGDMPLTLQSKILRVLQEREFERVGGTRPIKVDVRFIAATNKNLEIMAKEGNFREDLYFRLNVFTIYLPPLKNRKEDIPLIVERLLMDSPDNKVSLNSAALQLLMAYSWPGNIRELQNTIERATVMTDTGEIETEHLPDNITRGLSGLTYRRESGGKDVSIDDQIKEIEKGIIIEALRKADGVQIKAAEALGINQRSLWHRVKKHDINVKEIKNSK
jgi:transcriptional regulator with GAF, ATPase, and Fis domain